MTVVRDVIYHADGLEMTGTIAIPEGDSPLPLVLIGHEGPGLDDVQRRRASDVAALGYVGFAFDYHGTLSPFAEREDMMARLGELFADPARTRGLGRAALDVALMEPSVDPTRVAVIGYCFGATVALELARMGADVRAVVGFHPGLTNVEPSSSRNINGRVLMCIGADDPLIPLEHRLGFEAEMRDAGVRYDIEVYGGVQHSFTHPYASLANLPGIAYDERAALRSWNSMVTLLAEVF